LQFLAKQNTIMEAANAQVRFFQHLKSLLPPHMAMVDEVAELLGISNDSPYRRIRGGKTIDLEETYKLCNHFKISMDQLLHYKVMLLFFQAYCKTATGIVLKCGWKTCSGNFNMSIALKKSIFIT